MTTTPTSTRARTAPLLDAAFIRRLEALALAGRRAPAGGTVGQRRSRATGASVEFADHRTYTPGDDFRRIDWNAYARLGRLFLRLYRAEEDLTLALVLDTSASMAWGSPSKVRLAARLAAALGFIALRGGDRVDLATCRGEGVATCLRGQSGQAAIWPLWRRLEGIDCGGATNLDAALGACARQLRGPGLALVVSDLLSPPGYQRGLDALLGQGHDVVLVQVLAPDELEPPAELLGQWHLVDAEDDAEPVELTVTPSLVRAYRRMLAAYTQEIREFCRRRGVTYLLLRSDAPLDELLLRTFRQAGVLA